MWNLVDIVKFGQNSEIWSEFWKFGQSFENSWFAMVCIVMNVGRGYVIQNHELMTDWLTKVGLELLRQLKKIKQKYVDQFLYSLKYSNCYRLWMNSTFQDGLFCSLSNIVKFSPRRVNLKVKTSSMISDAWTSNFPKPKLPSR